MASKPTPILIREVRQAAGLSVEVAAAMIKVTPRAWKRWESADRVMSASHWAFFRSQLVKHVGKEPL